MFFIIKALKTKHRANEQLSEVNKKVYRSITYAERINTHNRELDDIIGRKFSTKSLIDFIRANYYRPTETQCKLLDKTLTEWRNGRPLIDDMTMVGIKI